MDSRKKIGATALARYEHIHVREDEKVCQGLSSNDDQRDPGDFAESAVRVHPGASDEQHGKHTDEERNDGEECEAEDIPSIPRRIIRRGIRGCRRKDLGRLAVIGG